MGGPFESDRGHHFILISTVVGGYTGIIPYPRIVKVRLTRLIIYFMPVLNSIGRVAAQSTHDEHASKVSPEEWNALFIRLAILGGYVLEIRTRALPFLHAMQREYSFIVFPFLLLLVP